MIYVIFSSALLLTTEGQLPEGTEPPIQREPEAHVFRLALPDGREVSAFATPLEEAPEGYRFVPLRQSYKLLTHEEYTIAAKARELLHWHDDSLFCGHCGGPMHFETEISKRCQHCGRELWPGLSPAVIVAVSRGDALLMVQSRNFRADYMGLVAGFVETGETLEECVRREVREETGLEIKNIRYFGSQSWPYPCGIMVGFTADCDGGEIRLQESELRRGGWYTPDHMPRVPAKMSIARRLIEDWLLRQGRPDVIKTLAEA